LSSPRSSPPTPLHCVERGVNCSLLPHGGRRARDEGWRGSRDFAIQFVACALRTIRRNSCSGSQLWTSAQAAAIARTSEADAHCSSASASREAYVNPPPVLPVSELVDELIKRDLGPGDPPADLEWRAGPLAGEVRRQAWHVTGCLASADLGIQRGRAKTARYLQRMVEQRLDRIQPPCEKREVFHQPKRGRVLDPPGASGVRADERFERKTGR